MKYLKLICLQVARTLAAVLAVFIGSTIAVSAYHYEGELRYTKIYISVDRESWRDGVTICQEELDGTVGDMRCRLGEERIEDCGLYCVVDNYQ